MTMGSPTRATGRSRSQRSPSGRGPGAPSILLFDLGGVLLRFRDEWCAQRVARRFGVPFRTVWKSLRRHRPRLQTGRIGLRTFWRNLARDLGHPLPADWRTLWTFELERKAGPRIAVVRWVRRLQAHGWRVGILSNTDASHVRVFRARRWFGGLVPELYSFELGAAKPQPELFRRVLSRLRLPASALLLVDDSRENVMGARSAGWHAVQYSRLGELRRDLRKLGIE